MLSYCGLWHRFISYVVASVSEELTLLLKTMKMEAVYSFETNVDNHRTTGTVSRFKSSPYILIIKPTRCTNFSIYFWNKTTCFGQFLCPSQEFSTVHTAMIYEYVIQVCRQLANGIRTELFRPDPARKLSANLYDIYHCCVYSGKLLRWTEELSETYRVLFQKKNLRN